MRPFARRIVALLASGLPLLGGCDAGSTAEARNGAGGAQAAAPAASGADAASGQDNGSADKPNILWIVWDTARSDHMSLYGHERPTTPNVDKWAAGARVYTNCISAASTTAPAHASMFTGLLPSEHGASNEHPQLDSRFDTLAELLRDKGGYDTYLFAANPHLTDSSKFTQGFTVAEHPWSPPYKAEAVRLIREKLDPRDQSSEMGRKMAAGQTNDWTIKTAGALAQTGVENWLDGRRSDKPSFIFLNYMEAHRPLLPAAEFRAQMMSPAEIEKSFAVDRSWGKTWAYTTGLAEYTDEEIELTRKTYDACLLELDDLFARLLAALARRGALENTIVILTSDHGEHLGEHHMLDHQYSLYDVLLRVPLVVRYPPAFPPGRDDSPVMNFDLFPTLLRLAGLPAPRGLRALDLERVPAERQRLSEYPVATRGPILSVQRDFPDFDDARWLRGLRALTEGDRKYICGSDGSHELYDLADDPGELKNLFGGAAAEAQAYCQRLSAFLATLRPPGQREQAAARSAEEIESLGALGYTHQQSEPEDAPAGIANFCRCGADEPSSDRPQP